MLKETVYSYSRLTTFESCPHAFNEKYNNKYEEGENGWGLGGGHAHAVIEAVLKGEIPPEDAADKWLNELPDLGFPTMTTSYVEKYIAQIHDFFKTFKGVNDEIIGIERHFKINIGGHWLQGYIDLETRTEKGLKAIDWKAASLSGFTGKNLKKKARQLYLYSESMKQEHGEYPKEMFFYMIKDKKPIRIEFSHKDLEEAKDWMKRTIEEIESEKLWTKMPQHFFCKNLCGIKTCKFNGGYEQ